MTLLTRTSVLIVGIYKGTIVNLETAGIREYRHRGRKTDRHWSRKLVRFQYKILFITVPLRSILLRHLRQVPCVTIYRLEYIFHTWTDIIKPQNFRDWECYENIMRKQRAWRDCHPVFFVWKCCEWCVWPRATDDNILLNCSPQHFLSQQSKEE